MKKIVITPAYYISEELLVEMQDSDIIVVSDAANPVFPFSQRESQILGTMAVKTWDIRLVQPGEADVSFKTAVKEVLEDVEIGEIVFTPTGDAGEDILSDLGEVTIVDDYRFGSIGDNFASYVNNSSERWNARYARDFHAIVTRNFPEVKLDSDAYLFVPYFELDGERIMLGARELDYPNVKLLELFKPSNFDLEAVLLKDIVMEIYTEDLLGTEVEYYNLSSILGKNKRYTVVVARVTATEELVGRMLSNDLFVLDNLTDVVFIRESDSIDFGMAVSWAWDQIKLMEELEEIELEEDYSDSRE